MTEKKLRTYRVFYYVGEGSTEQFLILKAMNFSEAEQLFADRHPDFTLSEISRVDFRVHLTPDTA